MTTPSRYSLPAVGDVTARNARSKLAEQLAAVARMNEAATTDLSTEYLVSVGEQHAPATLPARLDHWIAQLSANLKAITENLPDVDSWSVQVGFPWGVSVSVTFKTDTGQHDGEAG